MKHKRCNTNLLIFAVSFLVVTLIASFQVSAQETYPRKTMKHATKEIDNPQKFLSFIKEREYINSPYEIASPEAQQLLVRWELRCSGWGLLCD